MILNIISCERQGNETSPEEVIPHIPSAPDLPEIVEKTIWYSTSPDKIFTHVGGRAYFKCTETKCEVELAVYQFFINEFNVRSYSFTGNLNYSESRNVYIGGLRDTSGEEGYGIVIKDGLPILIFNQSKCLLFDKDSENRDEFDRMIFGMTSYSDRRFFYPYTYGIDLNSPACDY